MNEKPKIVCLGGGNAMPKGVLAGLKKHPVDISVICAMLDTGGSSGRLRRDYKINAPGDIRRALIALANTSPVIENLFNYRFETGELAGHNFANLLITALELSLKNGEQAIEEVEKLLNIPHKILPVTLDISELCAELENGEIIRGETDIDVPKHNAELKIKRIFLEPEAMAYPEAVKAILDADLITIGPGDLYSSIAQILLVKGIREALKDSSAKKLYLPNIMTKYGETNEFSILDFVRQIENWLGQELDFVLYNNFPIPQERIEAYKRSHPELMCLSDINFPLKEKFIGRKLVYDEGLIEHDAEKVAKAIMDILEKTNFF